MRAAGLAVELVETLHCKSMGAQETRSPLTARELVQSKVRDVENSLREIVRGFGLKVGKATERKFAGRIKELVAGYWSTYPLPTHQAADLRRPHTEATLRRSDNAKEGSTR